MVILVQYMHEEIVFNNIEDSVKMLVAITHQAKAAAAQANLIKQQEELERKAAELERKEQELENRRAGSASNPGGKWLQVFDVVVLSMC